MAGNRLRRADANREQTGRLKRKLCAAIAALPIRRESTFMNLKQTFTILALLSLAPNAHAQGGLTDIFRSISGALGGGQKEAAPQQQGVTATLGVRGMDEVDGKAAAPASGDYLLMEGWVATRPEAESAAGKKGLAARPATLKAKETPNAPANN
jgi:hypothetical protein